MGSSRARLAGANPGQEIMMGDEWGSTMPTMQQPSGQQQSPRWIEGGKFGGKDALALALAAISDVAAQQNGREGDAMSSLFKARAGNRELQQKTQLAGQQRQAERDDWVWKQEYARAHPTPVNNDTINDFNFYKGLNDEDRAIFHQMKPRYVQGPDGQFYPVAVGPAAPTAPPAITEDDWNRGTVMGGGAGNGAGSFPIPSGNPLRRPW